MQVMISHAHNEKVLAAAWKNLLETASQGKINVWYSSDTRPTGGLSAGEWRQILYDKIAESEVILATMTASSASRVWIQWECGVAQAQDNTKAVIPVLFGIDPEELEGPLAALHLYQGDERSAAIELLSRLLHMIGIEFNLDNPTIASLIDHYLSEIDKFSKEYLFNKLFSYPFHKRDDSLNGMWYIAWYNEADELYMVEKGEIVMEDKRFYVIGHTNKPGFTNDLPYYPMEGRLSADRIITMTYWDAYGFTLCGTLILKVAGTGKKMVGEWAASATDDPEDVEMHIQRGRVVWTRTDPREKA